MEPLVGLAPSVCTRPQHEFTKLALWLLRPRGLGKWRSHVDLHHELPASQTGVQNYLHLESMASVIGLAPIRPDVKGRLREWWPCANTF